MRGRAIDQNTTVAVLCLCFERVWKLAVRDWTWMRIVRESEPLDIIKSGLAWPKLETPKKTKRTAGF